MIFFLSDLDLNLDLSKCKPQCSAHIKGLTQMGQVDLLLDLRQKQQMLNINIKTHSFWNPNAPNIEIPV